MDCLSYTDDEVYLEEEDFREEYVLSDDGKLYAGWDSGPRDVPWNFGQVC